MNNIKKEIIENYNELNKDGEIHEFVETKVKEKFIDSFISPIYYGYTYKIIIDEDDIWITNAMSQSSDVMSVYEGEAIELTEIDAFNEFDCNLIGEDEIYNLTEDEKQELLNSLLEEESIQELKEELNENNEELTLIDILTEDYSLLEEHFKDILSDEYSNIEDAYIEGLWEDSAKGCCLNEIECAMEDFISNYTNNNA